MNQNSPPEDLLRWSSDEFSEARIDKESTARLDSHPGNGCAEPRCLLVTETRVIDATMASLEA